MTGLSVCTSDGLVTAVIVPWQAEAHESEHVRVPGVRGWGGGAAEDVQQRPQPALLPQRHLPAPAPPGDGGGQ